MILKLTAVDILHQDDDEGLKLLIDTEKMYFIEQKKGITCIYNYKYTGVIARCRESVDEIYKMIETGQN